MLSGFPCLNDIHREAKVQSIVTGYWDKSHIQVKKNNFFSKFTEKKVMRLIHCGVIEFHRENLFSTTIFSIGGIGGIGDVRGIELELR